MLQNAKSTALLLEDKKLLYLSVPRRPREQRRTFEQAWTKLLTVLGWRTPSAQDAASLLRIPFTMSFNSELEFDQALFGALTKCFQGRVLISKDIDKNFIILQHTGRSKNRQTDQRNGKEYAVGLARQQAVARNLCPDNATKKTALLNDSSANGMAYDSVPDHAVCLFEKDELELNNWEITDCFAVIELKTSSTTCAQFKPAVYEDTDMIEGEIHELDVVEDDIHQVDTQEGDIRGAHVHEGDIHEADDILEGKVRADLEYIQEPRLAYEHRSLAQAMLYSLGCVLPFHARRGTLGKALPIAILAGTKTVDTSSAKTAEDKKASSVHPQGCERVTTYAPKQHNEYFDQSVDNPKSSDIESMLRWVSASIGIPEACCGNLSYSVHDYDCFFIGQEDETMSIEQAMVLYIETLTFGLNAALQILHEFENNEMSSPKPASGQFLYVGDQKMAWELCASPILGANAVQDEKQRHWRISQGELFTGSLNVGSILAKVAMPVVDFRADLTTESKDEQVLIKASSRTVHFFLVDPLSAYLALEKICYTDVTLMLGRHLTTSARNLRLAHSVLLQEIGSVLHAAILIGAGMVTIMAELSQQGFGSLSPLNHSGKLSVLWDGFCNLVSNVLLPMAKLNIIHADIRPGYDETSNILCKIERRGTSDEKAVMKLIDYESVVVISGWNAPLNGSYIQKLSENWSATTYVWWQCLAVAYAWKTKTASSTFFNSDGLPLVSRIRSAMKSWMPGLRMYAFQDVISEEIVVKTLAKLTPEFHMFRIKF